jgi:hypothetical protein
MREEGATGTPVPNTRRRAASAHAPSPPVGPGRVLALAYGFFSLAAGARSGVQLGTHATRAPFAYSLSAVAAAIYLAGTVAVLAADRRPAHRRWAIRLCAVEIFGVLFVGTLSLLAPRAFPDASVWSHYGAGYGYVPAALPLLALFWLVGVNGGSSTYNGDEFG